MLHVMDRLLLEALISLSDFQRYGCQAMQLNCHAEATERRSQMEVSEGKAAANHDSKHLDEAERLALAHSTGIAVHSNSRVLMTCYACRPYRA